VKTVIYNISELVTMAPLAKAQKFTHIIHDDLGIVQNAWLTIENDKIVDFGDTKLFDLKGCRLIDAKQGIVFPGLIDSHTHPVFAGSRSHEFALRLDGKSYQDIAQLGGGIRHTVLKTREASTHQLADSTESNFKQMLRYGVTTIEAKSGYGLSVESELNQLRAINLASAKTWQRIIPTCLALHAIPDEFKDEESYVKEMTEVLLPRAAHEKLAVFVDAFIENGYFSARGSEIWLKTAKNLGLGLRIHADEFSDSGASELAADLNAHSADHLQFACDRGIEKMAKAGVVATLLPGTSLYSGIPFTNGRKFSDAGCPVAIATDFNPGSSPFDNLPFLAAMAGVHGKLRASEILAGITWVAAKSLNLQHKVGALATGYQADLVLHHCSSIHEWLADMGKTPPSKILISGKEVS
jgi:imidazolonepropionase